MKKERFEAMTDAVMAIVLTLMIMQIKIPEISRANIGAILQQTSIYAISFTMIAILWLNHHHIFSRAEGHISMNLVWINFMMLFCTSFIPMATEKLAGDFHSVGNHIFFSAVLALVCLFYTLLQHYMAQKVSYKNFSRIQLLNWGSVVLYLLAIPLSFVNVYISAFIYLAFISLYFVVSRRTMN